MSQTLRSDLTSPEIQGQEERKNFRPIRVYPDQVEIELIYLLNKANC